MLAIGLAVLLASCGSEAPLVESVPEESLPVEGVTIAYGAESDQFGRLSVPSSTHDVPVVVLVHGGFWQQQFDLSLMDPLAEDLAERGYAVWNIEYRRVGSGGTGGWPETGDDVGVAIDHLASLALTYPLDLGKVVLVGHSSGGHLALWSLQRPDARVTAAGAIGLGAIVDPSLFVEARALLGGRANEVPDVYAQATPAFDAERMTLIQAQFDRVVRSETLQSAQQAGVPVIVVANANHVQLIDPASQSWAATLDVIANVVG